MFGTRTDQPESRLILNAALDAGINFVDTANRYGREVVSPTVDYGGGLSEEYIGRALKDRGASARHQIVLATKVFGAMGPGPNDRGHSRVHVSAALEDSLRRLQTDYVDLYYLHWPDPETSLDEAARTMDDLVRAGKIRFWATSNHPAWKVTRLHWFCDRAGLHPPVAAQPGVTCPIIGPRTLEQFQDNAGALEWDLDAETATSLSALTTP